MIIESFFKMQTIKQRVNCLMWALSTRFKEVCLPSLFFHEVPFRHGLITPPTSPPPKKTETDNGGQREEVGWTDDRVTGRTAFALSF